VRFEPVSERWSAAWRVEYGRFTDVLGEPVDDAVAETVWSWLLARTHGVEAVLAIDGEQLVGFAHFRPFPRTMNGNEACYLDDLWVTDSHRGTGQGRALIERVCDIARERGWTEVRWVTEASNTVAQRLYDRIATTWDLKTYRIRLDSMSSANATTPALQNNIDTSTS
jgi:ribosomal protein S18 acetylase RimI-like enzyme